MNMTNMLSFHCVPDSFGYHLNLYNSSVDCQKVVLLHLNTFGNRFGEVRLYRWSHRERKKNKCQSFSCVQLFATTKPVRLLCPWDIPGKNTGVDCHFLLQGISLTQGLNLGLLHCRQILYHLSHQVTQLVNCSQDVNSGLHFLGALNS